MNKLGSETANVAELDTKICERCGHLMQNYGWRHVDAFAPYKECYRPPTKEELIRRQHEAADSRFSENAIKPNIQRWLDDYAGLNAELSACVRFDLTKAEPAIWLEGMRRLIAGLIGEYSRISDTSSAPAE